MKTYFLLLISLLSHFFFISQVKSLESIHLSADSLKQHEHYWLRDHWSYHSGDSSEWSKFAFDDSDWEFVNPSLQVNKLPASGWTGLGWFRIHLVVDSTLWRQPLIMNYNQAGTAHIYLNGRLLYKFNANDHRLQQKESPNYRGYTTFSFDEQPHQVIAIRYENKKTDKFHKAGREAGFFLAMGEANKTIERGIDHLKRETVAQIGFATFAIAFGILHLVLFLFYPTLKSNLFFAITVFLYAVTIFFDYQNFLATNLVDNLIYLRIHRAVMPFPNIFAMLFIYSIFAGKIPKQFWLIALGLIVTGGLAVYKPVYNFDYVLIFILAAFAELVRILIQAIRHRKEGAWIIAIGFVGLFLFSSYDIILDLNVMSPIYDINNGYPFGFVVLIISMSVYLAREFARTNEKILEQERRVKEEEIARILLEADNARKTKELEEARQLQLSMLPKKITSLPGLEICFHMQTATEVGGDYYDYLIAEDGTFTIGIGDATGHGTKAGTMVAVIKSLFVTHAAAQDMVSFLQKCSHTIRQMQFGNLYMGMILAKLNDKKMTISSAGMPPIYIYRDRTQSVEELIIKALPLGATSSFSTEVKTLKLETGDTVLLLSDGYIELFNDQDEMLDYPRVIQYFQEVGEQSPDAIVAHLIERGDQWRKGRSQLDDITFVVFKVKEN